MKEIIPIEGASKPEQVTRSLEKQILTGQNVPGEQLPSHRELATQFNVGIRSIREALKTLETRGLVDVRQGKGVFVKADNLDFYMESLTDSMGFRFPQTKQMLLALTQVRLIIETAIVKNIAMRPDASTISVLRGIVVAMESTPQSPEETIEHQRLDTLFHMSIVEASSNVILITFYKHLSRLLFSSMLKSGKIFSNMEKGRREHRALLEALVAREPDRAVAIITEHLDNTRRVLETILPDTESIENTSPRS